MINNTPASFGLKSRNQIGANNSTTKSFLAAPGNMRETTRYTTKSNADNGSLDKSYALKSSISHSQSEHQSPDFPGGKNKRMTNGVGTPDYETLSPQSKRKGSGLSHSNMKKDMHRSDYMNVLEPDYKRQN